MSKLNESLKKDWNEYLFQDGVEYSIEEIVRVIAKMFQFMKDKGLRIDITMITDAEGYSKMFQLSPEQIKKYEKYFENLHYDNESVRKIVQCMNVVYHTLDITIEEALDFAEYASDNRLTLTKGINEKFGIDFNEINLFMDEVMTKNVEFCIKQVAKYGIAIIEDIKKLL